MDFKKYYIAFFTILVLSSASLSAKTIGINPEMAEQINELIGQAQPGDEVRFAPGRYFTKETIFIKKKHDLKISGAKKAEFILHDKDSVVFVISESDNIVVDGIKARHIKPIYPGQFCSGAVFIISESHDIEIINSEFNGSGTIGVSIDNSLNIHLANLFLHNNTVAAIELYGLLDGVIIENNRIVHNPKFLKINGTSKNWKKYVLIRNNKME